MNRPKCGKLKGKGVLVEQIVIHGHLKSQSQYAAHGIDCGVASAVLLELDEKELRVRGLYLAEALSGKLFFLQQIGYKLVVHKRIGLTPVLVAS